MRWRIAAIRITLFCAAFCSSSKAGIGAVFAVNASLSCFPAKTVIKQNVRTKTELRVLEVAQQKFNKFFMSFVDFIFIPY